MLDGLARNLQELAAAFIQFRNEVVAYVRQNNNQHDKVVRDLQMLEAQNKALKVELESLKGSIAELILLKG